MNPDRFFSFIRGGAKQVTRPTFSLCHTTARLPDGWRAAAQAWHDAADNTADIEHVLVTDDPAFHAEPIFSNTKIGLNRGRKCAVDGWNKSAELSTGRFLITLADDWFPCPHWDTEFLKRIPNLDGEHVLEVDTGGNPGLLTFSLLTRAYYEKFGYLFWPEYLGMYADNEFTDVARRDGVVIDARDLFCEHRHPLYGHGEMDATHKHQHSKEAFKRGEEVYMRRRYLLGFDPKRRAPKQFTVAVCLPGQAFRADWVANWTTLIAYLKDQVHVLPVFGYAPNPHITRACMLEHLLQVDPLPDLVLWIDHDNIVSPVHFAKLFESLLEHPEADGVTGWCWWGDPARISAGFFNGDVYSSISHQQLMAGSDDLKPIDWTGFPCFLMRGETLKKVGPRPFLPVLSDLFPYGFAPEDKAFCMKAKENGCQFFVDRRVEVEHQKTAPVQPKREQNVA